MLYQRLVARDQDGATEIVEDLLETQTLLEVYEDVLIPALYYTTMVRTKIRRR
jgi:B12 binding domain